jgi:hypothetical protein
MSVLSGVYELAQALGSFLVILIAVGMIAFLAEINWPSLD